jgi:hypothetical protein
MCSVIPAQEPAKKLQKAYQSCGSRKALRSLFPPIKKLTLVAFFW